MRLTRREFAAATAGGLSLFSVGTNAQHRDAASSIGPIRHAHLELPAGPYRRAELARIVSCAADAAGLLTPNSTEVLGAALVDDLFPRCFVLTCSYPGGCRLVVRASVSQAGAPELTLRGQHRDAALRYLGGEFRS